MKEKGWRRIIAISSGAGRVGHSGAPIYGAAKAAIIGLMKTLSNKMGGDGITTNSIALGLVNTVSLEKLQGHPLEISGQADKENPLDVFIKY